ncbi:MAG: hypothetical protein F6K42_19385, partial [Leptolyngbya sp. SIO1D8]|nr:hypothetical protein [Leptolyngbya sp. SIO1D8]
MKTLMATIGWLAMWTIAADVLGLTLVHADDLKPTKDDTDASLLGGAIQLE